jgi:altronate dehydratase small subunit
MAKRSKAIVINEKDNVATALKTLRAGARVSVEAGGLVQEVTVLSEIPAGHKFALQEIGEGEPVIKYGEPIGRSTVKIAAGDYVHVHNVVSQPRGDF